MSTVRKYANLPDLDLAPDVYETPELTEDNSTIPTSDTQRSDSPQSHDDADGRDGIVRQHIHQDEARSRFLSDIERRAISPTRIGEKRRTHAEASTVRNAEIDGILPEVSAPTDEDREESVARKLARLRREVVELQSQIKQEKDGGGPAGSDSNGETDEAEIGRIVSLLKATETAHTKSQRNATARLLDRVNQKNQSGESRNSSKPENFNAADSKTNTGDDRLAIEDDTLSVVVKLDARLKDLEDLLGVDILPSSAQDSKTVKPLLPALDTLDKQYTFLSTTSENAIEKIRDRVQELANDASNLETKRSQAKKALENLSNAQARSRSKSGTLPDGVPKLEVTDDYEQTHKINALYGTLTTIDNVAPLLPKTLDRLRSLRDLHANAAEASQMLSELEREQQVMQEELRRWKAGIERTEAAISASHETLRENTGTVEEWVQELEERVKGLESS